MIPTAVVAGIIILIYSNHKSDYSQLYQTFWPRFWSPTIDLIILLPFDFLLYSLCPYDAENLSPYPIAELASNFIYLVYIIFMNVNYGGSVGKLLCKIKIVDHQTNRRITYSQAFLRDSIPFFFVFAILFLVPTNEASLAITVSLVFLVWFLAEIITMLSNQKRRALHDFIAGTVVVRSDLNI